MYMRKFSQTELLNEAFPDLLKGAVKLAKKVAKAGAGVISPTAVDVYDKTKAGLKNLTSTYSSEQPLSVLKKALEKSPNIEFIKLIKQEQRTANPSKGKFQSKNVTLITFQATVYRKGLERAYKVYEAANNIIVSKNNLSVPNRNINQARARTVSSKAPRLPGGSDLSISKQAPSMRQAQGRVIDAEIPRLPNETKQKDTALAKSPEGGGEVKTLTAEVFRTSEGLQVGEIYDTATGAVYSSGDKNKKPVFSTTITNYKGTTQGGYLVKNILAYLTKEIGLSNSSAKNIAAGAKDLQDMISKLTGIAPISLTTVIPDSEIQKIGDALRPVYVENKLNHKETLKEIFLLEKKSRIHLQS